MKNCTAVRCEIIFFIFIIPFCLFSQREDDYSQNSYIKLYHQIQSTYGPDQELLNGIFFEDYYRKAIGHPFLHENRFYRGSVVFRNTLYNNVELKFDIFDQRVIINYSFNGEQVPVILPNKFISYFILEGKHFKNISFDGKNAEIYQVIGKNNGIQCLYKWTKNRVESDHLRTTMSYKFTEDKRKKFLLTDGEIIRYYGKRSFLNAFSEKWQQQIKQFIRSNKINLRKSDDDKIKKLLDFCNTIVVER